MKKNKNIDCVANVTTGVCIFSMTPVLFRIEGASIYGCIPWMLAALPILIISIIWLFKEGELISGLATAILSGITLIGNAYFGIMELYIKANNIDLTLENVKAMKVSSGSVMLSASVILMLLTYLSLKQDYVQAFFTSLACVGFVGISLNDLGIYDLGLLPGVLLFVFALWEIYFGMASLLKGLTGKEVLPYQLKVRKVG